MKNKKGLMRFGSKSVLLIGALALILGGTIGGTLAWMFDKVDISNTFVIGDISIALTESDMDSDGNEDTNAYSFTSDPEGDDNKFAISKDAQVTVHKGSEDCWLFVKVKESANFKDFLEYAMADGWEELKPADQSEGISIWYRQVKDVTDDTIYDVLKDKTIYVKSNVSQAQLDALEEKDYPTLTFSAYAIQIEEISSAAEAWEKLDK